MRRFTLLIALVLLTATCAVAQVPNRFLPPEITGKDALEALSVRATGETTGLSAKRVFNEDWEDPDWAGYSPIQMNLVNHGSKTGAFVVTGPADYYFWVDNDSYGEMMLDEFYFLDMLVWIDGPPGGSDRAFDVYAYNTGNAVGATQMNGYTALRAESSAANTGSGVISSSVTGQGAAYFGKVVGTGGGGNGKGRCMYMEQAGPVVGTNTLNAVQFRRTGAGPYTQPIFQVGEEKDDNATDLNATFRMNWIDGYPGAGTGKTFIDFWPGTSTLNADHNFFSWAGRSDFKLDLAGNLVLPAGGSVSVGGTPLPTSGSPGVFMTTDTAQAISGVKTFKATQVFEVYNDDAGMIIEQFRVDHTGLRNVFAITGTTFQDFVIKPYTGNGLELQNAGGDTVWAINDNTATMNRPGTGETFLQALPTTGGQDSYINGPVSIRDSAGTTQIRVGSIPNCPNGLLSQGETVLTSVSAANLGYVTTATAQTISANKNWTNYQTYNISGATAFGSRMTYNSTIPGTNAVRIQQSSASGNGLRIDTDGTMAGSSTIYGLLISREHNLNGNTDSGAVVQLTDNLSGSTSDTAPTISMLWGDGFSSGGKAFLKFDPSVATLYSGDYVLKHARRSDFFWDLAGNLSTPGRVTTTSVYAPTGSDLNIQAASGQQVFIYSPVGANMIQVPATGDEVKFFRGIEAYANATDGTQAAIFNGQNVSRMMTISGGMPTSGGITDNLVQLQVNGKTLTGNFNGDIFTIYKSGNTIGANTWSKALQRIWDNDAYSANVTGPLLRLQWTNTHSNGRALLDFTIPSGEVGGSYLFKVGNDLGSTLTFEADTDGNMTSDGEADFDSYVSSGGAADLPEGFDATSATANPVGKVDNGGTGNRALDVNGNSGIGVFATATSGQAVKGQASNTGICFLATATDSTSKMYEAQPSGSNTETMYGGSTTQGGGISIEQGGTLSSNNGRRVAYFRRNATLSGNDYTNPLMQLEENIQSAGTTSQPLMRASVATAHNSSKTWIDLQAPSGQTASDDVLDATVNGTTVYKIDWGGVTTANHRKSTHATYSSTATVTTTVQTIYVDASSNDIELTFSVVDGAEWDIKMTTDPGANTVTIKGATGNIDGAASSTRLDTQNEALTVKCDGSNFWFF